MMYLYGIGRIGRDAELRHLPNGDPVLNLSIAFNYGKPGADGNKATQWAEFTLYGRRAESVAPHLTKGKQIGVMVEDAHIDEYTKRDGTSGAKLVGRILGLDFVAAGERQEQSEQRQQAPRAAAQRQAPAQTSGGGGGNGSGFEDMDDGIPFATCTHDLTTRLERRMRRYD